MLCIIIGDLTNFYSQANRALRVGEKKIVASLFLRHMFIICVVEKTE